MAATVPPATATAPRKKAGKPKASATASAAVAVAVAGLKKKAKKDKKDKRPKKKNKEAVVLRFEGEQLAAVDERAQALGLSRAAWVRMIVSQALAG
jgi:hypothetical protein